MKSIIVYAFFLFGFVLPVNAVTPANPDFQENQSAITSIANTFKGNPLFKIPKMVEALHREEGKKSNTAKVLIGLSIGFGILAVLSLSFFLYGFLTASPLFLTGISFAAYGLKHNKKSAKPSRLLKKLGKISFIFNVIGFLGLLVLFFFVLTSFGG